MVRFPRVEDHACIGTGRTLKSVVITTPSAKAVIPIFFRPGSIE